MKRMVRTSSAGGTAGLGSALSLVAMFAAVPALGQGFTIEQALNYPYGVTAAAQGERIAWVFDLRGARNVWTADGPDFAARQMTHYTEDAGMPNRYDGKSQGERRGASVHYFGGSARSDAAQGTRTIETASSLQLALYSTVCKFLYNIESLQIEF